MVKKLILLLFAIVLSALGTFALECAHRSYGFDGTVCVCNATYCDNIAPLTKTPKGVVTSYVTSLSGDRFHKSELHFSANALPTNVSTISINIDHKQRFQKIIGFGAVFTDATGINIGHLPKEMQTRLIKDYFGPDGIEYTLGRIPIGGTDYSPRAYTLHEVANDDNLTKFSLAQEDFDYKIPYINLAQQVSPHKITFFASPWSAPSWIKTNNEINHGGFVLGKPGERYYKIFAKYFVKFIEEIEKHNITIWGITVDNEPGSGYDKKYAFNSLGFDGALERDFVKLDLGPELHASGHGKVKIMIYDDMVHNPKDSHGIERFVTDILSDKEAEKYVSGIAYHWYNPSDRKELDRLHHKFPNQFILGTEACELRAPRLGEWSIMERFAYFIILDLTYFSTGWTGWNFVIDPLGRSHWDEPHNDRFSYNAPIVVNATSHEYYKQPQFYSMGHFSKFIVPDSVRIHHDLHGGDARNVFIIAFERPDQATVLVALNQNKHPVELQVHDPVNGFVKFELKANSLETLVWY